MAYKYILNLSCPDRTGIVCAVSGFLSSLDINILSSAQYFDRESGKFFMRVEVSSEVNKQELPEIAEKWTEIAQKWRMQSQWFDAEKKARVLIMVSKEGHCLNDLLFQAAEGHLPIEVIAVAGNHEILKPYADFYQIPFYYWALNGNNDANKVQQERKLIDAVEQLNIDTVVLARYMQILSPQLCAFLEGRAINIHHSFLPSFKGAKPYYQAHARGVKLIGATAHYVSTDLDEGPIIEQDVARVRHDKTVEELTSIGNDIERIVLSRALRWHAEHRVIINGNKTVVFN
ncbi:MAG: formyltetrahydrofolate deformylase [Cardiobacteriaceae bacterium]|nr:formyltetrahydrofolate deformylase [Cardiobacteriaceae bacterium]